jgi:hypothetical protein
MGKKSGPELSHLLRKGGIALENAGFTHARPAISLNIQTRDGDSSQKSTGSGRAALPASATVALPETPKPPLGLSRDGAKMLLPVKIGASRSGRVESRARP